MREPGRLFLATDANPDALQETAWKAGRKAARGGASNLLCIAEPLDALAPALGAIADRLTVIMPWGNLLQTVASPKRESLRNLATLCLPDAAIEIVLSYDGRRDSRENSLLGPTRLDEQHMLNSLPRLYQEAGLRIIRVEKLSNRELVAYETTWANRLAFGKPRDVWRIQAKPGGVAR